MNRDLAAPMTVRVPGDKSISHRAVLLGALAQGTSRVRGFLRAGDTLRSVDLVRALGVDVVEEGPDTLRIVGAGLRGLRGPADRIDAGNSGTTLRIGAGLLAGQPFEATVTGDDSLRGRPMDRIVAPLVAMGARIDALGEGGRAPLAFRGGRLHGGDLAVAVASAQVKSAILLAGLRADGPVRVTGPAATRDHTERMLAAMGADVAGDGLSVRVLPADRLAPLDLDVPGDLSSAAFFLVLAACVPGLRVRLPGVGVNPGRRGVLDVLARMGCPVTEAEAREAGAEPVADLDVTGGDLCAATIDPAEVPSLVDEIPALCVAAALARGRTEVRGAAELRVKESDRISAMVDALGTLGVPCGAWPDGLWIEGPARLRPGQRCSTRGDHRVAMALTVLAAATGVDIALDETASVATSYPGFFSEIECLKSDFPKGDRHL